MNRARAHGCPPARVCACACGCLCLCLRVCARLSGCPALCVTALRVYHTQLTATRMRSHAGLIESLISHTRGRVQLEKDTIGFNLAGLRHVQQEMEEAGGARFFGDVAAIRDARCGRTATALRSPF